MTRLLIIDTGSDTAADEVYQVLEDLPVDVTLCHHDSPRMPKNARRQLEYQAERLGGVPLHMNQNIPELLTASHPPDHLLILMSPDEVAAYAISLLETVKAHYDAVHPRIMFSNPPGVTSLIGMIQLIAHAENFGIEVWLKATTRYAAGVQDLYRNALNLAPLTQMGSSIITGVHYTGGISELMQIVWHQTDLLSSIATVAEKGREFSGIPLTITAEYASMYRDSLSAALSFNGGNLVACLSVTTSDTGNLGFREVLHVTGIGGTLELNESLSACRYINLLDADEEEPTVSAEEFMDFVRQEILETEKTPWETVGTEETEIRLKRMLHDFLKAEPSRHAPTLRSCLPGIWTANALLRSLEDKGRIDRGHDDRNRELFYSPQFLAVEHSIEKLALGGHLETAIDSLKSKQQGTSEMPRDTQNRTAGMPHYADINWQHARWEPRDV